MMRFNINTELFQTNVSPYGATMNYYSALQAAIHRAYVFSTVLQVHVIVFALVAPVLFGTLVFLMDALGVEYSPQVQIYFAVISISAGLLFAIRVAPRLLRLSDEVKKRLQF